MAKKMENKGSYPIYFTGSNRTLWRNVYKDGDKYYAKWYGNLIEVERGFSGYFQTVEEY